MPYCLNYKQVSTDMRFFLALKGYRWSARLRNSDIRKELSIYSMTNYSIQKTLSEHLDRMKRDTLSLKIKIYKLIGCRNLDTLKTKKIVLSTNFVVEIFNVSNHSLPFSVLFGFHLSRNLQAGNLLSTCPAISVYWF